VTLNVDSIVAHEQLGANWHGAEKPGTSEARQMLEGAIEQGRGVLAAHARAVCAVETVIRGPTVSTGAKSSAHMAQGKAV